MFMDNGSCGKIRNVGGEHPVCLAQTPLYERGIATAVGEVHRGGGKGIPPLEKGDEGGF
jgi:hypothetical protein